MINASSIIKYWSSIQVIVRFAITRSKSVNILKTGLFVLLCTQIILLSPAFAEFNSYSNNNFAAQCSVRQELYDPEIMANTMANPEEFKKFMAVMKHPDTFQIIMSCASNPEQWTAMMSKVSDPNKMMNTMMVFMNPQMYFNWMTAVMDPNYHTPM